jgi:hypothetical protein
LLVAGRGGGERDPRRTTKGAERRPLRMSLPPSGAGPVCAAIDLHEPIVRSTSCRTLNVATSDALGGADADQSFATNAVARHRPARTSGSATLRSSR